MSTTLFVHTSPGTGPRSFFVRWIAGVHTRGVLQVDVVADVVDADVVAELSAVQHLLEVQGVCSQDRRGKNLTIGFSCGGVRKLAQGRSPKKHLAPYALFLRTRFAEADIEMSKKAAFDLALPDDSHALLIVSGPRPSCIVLRNGEEIGVAFHAFDNFCKRFGRTSQSDAWGELLACGTHSAPRPGAPSVEETFEHGASVRAFDCFNGARLIVVDGQPVPMLVTTYWHHSAESNYQKFCQSAA